MDVLAVNSKVRDRRVCVVGAGPCGLTAIKNLLAAGIIEIVCYDDGASIGGNWVFDETSVRRSVYDSPHLISSKRLSEFEDHPMPADYSDYPSHRLMRAYFETYAAHFGLLPYIRLGMRVETAALQADGKWAVSVSDTDGVKITGRLPRPANIETRIRKQIANPHWRFDSAPRHAYEVDYHDFRTELCKELAAVAHTETHARG